MRSFWGVRVIAVTGCAAAASLLCGCSSESPGAAEAAANSFVSAVERGDGAAACKLLTKDAESAVSGATDVSCAKAIVSLEEHGHTVAATEVWGDAAQVHIGGDVLFLRRFPAGWLISAAGCVRQPVGPYDCTVS